MPSIAVVEELLERNPAEGIPHPRSPQRKGIALKPEQVQMLARSFDDEQARVAFLTFVLTGVRRAELQALRWRDVDLIENVLCVVDSESRGNGICPRAARESGQPPGGRSPRPGSQRSS